MNLLFTERRGCKNTRRWNAWVKTGGSPKSPPPKKWWFDPMFIEERTPRCFWHIPRTCSILKKPLHCAAEETSFGARKKSSSLGTKRGNRNTWAPKIKEGKPPQRENIPPKGGPTQDRDRTFWLVVPPNSLSKETKLFPSAFKTTVCKLRRETFSLFWWENISSPKRKRQFLTPQGGNINEAKSKGLPTKRTSSKEGSTLLLGCSNTLPTVRNSEKHASVNNWRPINSKSPVYLPTPRGPIFPIAPPSQLKSFAPRRASPKRALNLRKPLSQRSDYSRMNLPFFGLTYAKR